MEMFDFGEALKRIKAGRRVQRAGWNGKRMHVYLEDAHEFTIRAGIFRGQTRMREAHLVLFTAQGAHQPGWLASQADMLADDWQEV